MFHRHLSLCCMIVCSLAGIQLLAVSSGETQQSISKLDQALESVRSGQFRDFDPYMSFSGSLDEITTRYRDVFEKYEAAKKNEIADLNQLLEDFEKTYGSSEKEIDDRVLESLGSKPQRRTSWVWSELKKEITQLNAFGEMMAQKLLEDVQRDLQHIDAFSDQIKDKKYAQVTEFLEIANGYDPGNDAVKELLKSIGDMRKESNKVVNAKIDARTWDPHSPLFNGPGDPDKLAKEVERYIELVDEKEGKKDSVIAVRISGDWRVAEKTLLGAPVNYGLPVHVAFRMKSDSKTAKVLSLTMITRDAEKKPPFQGNWVGDNWQIRTKAIQKAGSSNGNRGPNPLFKLLLSATLLLSGLIAIMPWMEAKNPEIADGFAVLKPLRGWIGVITLGVGIFFFVLSLLNPFSNILPQAAAMVTGLFLGLELIIKTSARNAKAEELVRKGEVSIRKLESIQFPLGWTCILLGILHMIMGGVLFF